jgi:hypothetical protein
MRTSTRSLPDWTNLHADGSREGADVTQLFLRHFPWVLASALALIVAAFVFLYLVAEPGARLPPPADESTGVLEPAVNP